MSAWVRVKDRLPDDFVSVIGWVRFKGEHGWGANEVFYDRSDKEWDSVRDDFTIAKVTHWMPMPDGPEARS